MKKPSWTKYAAYAAVLAIGLAGGFIGKATADGTIHSYVGCSLPK